MQPRHCNNMPSHYQVNEDNLLLIIKIILVLMSSESTQLVMNVIYESYS